MIERYNLEGNIDPNGPLVFYEDYESLAARLADYEDAHRVTVEDCGAPDEQHCSCVPSLRLEMKRLQSRLAEAERLLTDTWLLPDGRNPNLEREVWDFFNPPAKAGEDVGRGTLSTRTDDSAPAAREVPDGR